MSPLEPTIGIARRPGILVGVIFLAVLAAACGSSSQLGLEDGLDGRHSLVDFGDKKIPVPEFAVPWASVATSTADGSAIYFDVLLDASGNRIDADGRVPGTPAIVRRDQKTGREMVIAEDALAPVVAPDGRLAYARGTSGPFAPGERYLSDVVVAGSDGTTTVWVDGDGASVMPVAWAGDTLIVMRIDPVTGFASTVLARSGGTSAPPHAGLPMAISPDGEAILFSTDRSDLNRLLVLVDAKTFAPIQSISFDQYAAAFMPGAPVDPATAAPDPDGELPLGPRTGFSIWAVGGLVVQGDGLLFFRTEKASTWSVEPWKRVPLSTDERVATSVDPLVLLDDGGIGVNAALTASTGSPPPPPHASPDSLRAHDDERQGADARATSRVSLRCELRTATCVADVSLAASRAPFATNYSR